MNFFIQWIIFYIAIMFAMCIDNLFWIPADRRWFFTKELKQYFYVLFVFRGREYIFPKDKWAWNFIFHNRIKSVLTHQYDIIPGIITSLILTIVFN